MKAYIFNESLTNVFFFLIKQNQNFCCCTNTLNLTIENSVENLKFRKAIAHRIIFRL